MKLNKLATLIFLINYLTYCQCNSTLNPDQEQEEYLDEKLQGSIQPKQFNPEIDPIDRSVFETLIIFLNKQNNLLIINRVTDCKVQIISGMNYFLKLEVEQNLTTLLYEAQVRTYLDEKKEPKVIYANQIYENKEDQQLTEKDIEDGVYNFVLTSIHRKFQEEDESLIDYSTVSDFKILEKQVVSGMKYTCKVLLQNPKLDFKQQDDYKGFLVQVIHQAWVNKFELVSIESYNYTEQDLQDQINEIQQHQMFGGWLHYEISDDNDEILKVIRSVLLSEFPKRNITGVGYKIIDVQTQIVSGYNIKVHLLLDTAQELEIIIYYQKWNQLQRVISFEYIDTLLNQSPSKAFVKAHNGGWTEINIYSEEYKEIYDLSLKAIKDYMSLNGISTEFTIIKTQKQIVSGIKLKTTVKIDKKIYDVEIFIKPWSGYTKVISFDLPESSQNYNHKTESFQEKENQNSQVHDDL